MKWLFFIILIIGEVALAQAQVIKHHRYITHYNAILKEPDSVSWYLTPAMVDCNAKAKRSNDFQPDPEIPGSAHPRDYKVNHGKPRTLWIDKGHLFNADEAACDGIFADECYYMSNMLPQFQSFNEGDWKKLEIQEQKWAKTDTLHILAGGIGSIGHLLCGENIPKYMWKAIYKHGNWMIWIMLNDPSSKGHAIDFWERTATELDAKTGLHL